MSAWLFPIVPDTRGTWTGVVAIDRLAGDVTEHATANAMVLLISDGTPIKMFINGSPLRESRQAAAVYRS
jgi:hypothetical protein